jgi:hypothetical protein
MDPQKLSQLDPKLREAYLRVMGTEITAPQGAPSVQAPNPVPQFQAQQEPSRPFVPTAQAIPGFGQGNSETPTTTSPAGLRMTSPIGSAPAFRPQPVASEKRGMMPVLFALVGVIFIVIYAFFWTRVFDLKLPFSP